MNKYPDIYFLPEWGKLFQEHDKGKIDIFNFKCSLGTVYYQFIKRKIPLKLKGMQYWDTVTTYGFNGPVILECEKSKKKFLVLEFNQAFQQYCMDNQLVSEYIRFNPWLKNHLDFDKFYEAEYNNYTLFTDLTTTDFFMDEFSSKIRNLVRKAIKNGVKIKFDFIGSTIEDFQRLYRLMIQKNEVSDYYLFKTEFLKKTFKVLKKNQFIIYGIYQGEIISSAIFLHHNDYVHYHLSANDPLFYPLNANSLILYEACKWGKKNKKKQLHLGGAFTKELFAYKKQFTKNGICDYYIGKKIRNKKIFDDLVALRSNHDPIKNKDYFPLYRG
jgi:hypothetical protein